MRLKFEMALHRETEKATDRLLLADWSQPRVYAEWLAQTYHFVSYTGRLICQASGRFSLEDQAFHKMMTSHFNEEEDHENMAKRDLEAMGFRMSELPEWPLTKVFHEHLSFQIEKVSPFCIFGRIYFLEGLACEAGPEILARLQPEILAKSGSFLKLHAEEDQLHHAESLKLLSKMSVQQLDDVYRGFETTVAIYSAITQKLLSDSASTTGSAGIKAA